MLIEEGIVRAALSDRQSAAAIGAPSGGAARADGFARQPIGRMTNISIEPGDGGTLEELIAGVDEGVYMENNRSWSIDDRRLNFQFGTEVGRRGSAAAACSAASCATRPTMASRRASGPRSRRSRARSAWRLWGLQNCGKGELGQLARVSHGAAPAPLRVTSMCRRPAM